MHDAGRVAMVPKGEWNAITEYEFLDVVTYNDSAFVAKQDNTGHAPVGDGTDSYWMKLVESGAGRVSSFNGRIGSILPLTGDYNDAQVVLSSTMHIGGATQTNVNSAISALDLSKIETVKIDTEEEWNQMSETEKNDPTKIYLLPWKNSSGGGGGGGGHTIVTSSALPMAGRSNLQFNGATLVDDENNDTTVVNIPQTTFNGRSGSVMPVAGDYTSDQITLSSVMHIGGETQSNVTEALSALDEADDAKLDIVDQQVVGAWNFVENTAITETRQGVTFTVNPTGYPKGTIKMNSSASPTGGIDFQVNSGFKVPAGTYYLKQNDYPSTGINSRISVGIKNGSQVAYDGNFDHSHRQFTLTEETELIFRIYANRDGSIGALNNVIIYPMISLEDDTPYVPYAMTNRDLMGLVRATTPARVVATATSSTYSSILSTLNTAFTALKEAEKRRAKIYIGGNTFYVTNIDIGTFAITTIAVLNNVKTLITIGLRLSTAVAYRTETTPSGTSFIDLTSENTGATAVLVTGV